MVCDFAGVEVVPAVCTQELSACADCIEEIRGRKRDESVKGSQLEVTGKV